MVFRVTWSETPSASSRKRMIQEVRYGHSSVRLIQDASRSQLKMIWLALRRRPIKTYYSILLLYTCKCIIHVFKMQCKVLTMLYVCEYNEVKQTCDRDDVEQSPHGLRADVTKPVFSDQQLGQVKGHLPCDRALHLSSAVCVLQNDMQRRYT